MHNLTLERLREFSDEFMPNLCKASIAYENYSNDKYSEFYDGFWNHFKNFVYNKEEFNKTEILNKVYNDFHELIVDKTSHLGINIEKPTSGAMCIKNLNELRKLEER